MPSTKPLPESEIKATCERFPLRSGFPVANDDFEGRANFKEHAVVGGALEVFADLSVKDSEGDGDSAQVRPQSGPTTRLDGMES